MAVRNEEIIKTVSEYGFPRITPENGYLHKLHSLVYYHHKPGLSIIKNLTHIALLLSDRVGKSPAYSWQYCHQVAHGTLLPSKILIRAIDLVFLEIDNSLPLELEQVTVFAPIGLLTSGTIVTKQPKYCHICGSAYVPVNGTQKYCLLCKMGKVAKRHTQFP